MSDKFNGHFTIYVRILDKNRILSVATMAAVGYNVTEKREKTPWRCPPKYIL